MLTKTTRIFKVFTVISILCFSINLEAAETSSHLSGMTSYDAHLPLDSQVIETLDFNSYLRHKVAFRSFDNEVVFGYLAIPKLVKTPPVVLALHGITQSKHQWWRPQGPYSFPDEHRKELLKKGVAVFAIDLRNHGERIYENDFKDPREYLEKSYFSGLRYLILHSIIDGRRAIDFLESRNDIDGSNIGVIGFSLGGMVAWGLAGTDNRVGPMVAMGSPPELVKGGKEWISPLVFAPLTRNPVLMLMGKRDSFYTEKSAHKLFARVGSEDKVLSMIESGHDFPRWTANHVSKWLSTKLSR